MGGSSAPEQPTTKTNMANFGYTTSGKFGSEWSPTNFQKQFITGAENQITNAQNALSDQTVSEDRIKNLYNTFTNDFNKNYISPALQRGLLRGSTASDIYTMGQKDFVNQYQSLLDEEEQRNYQRLANALSNYTTLYDIAQGTTGLSNSMNQAVSNYALAKAAQEQAAKNATMGLISGGLGTLGSVGGTLGGAKILASDERLKENIKLLDTVSGINIYEFEYKKGLGLPDGKQIGVIAQELGNIPQVVITTDYGYLAVNYDLLPEKVQDRIKELRGE